jgi:hypothetical protein
MVLAGVSVLGLEGAARKCAGADLELNPKGELQLSL